MNGEAKSVHDAFLNFKPRPCDAWLFEPGPMRDQLERQCSEFNKFPVFALPNNQNPTVICGMVHAHGVGEVWMVTGVGFERSVREVLPVQRQLCKAFFELFKLRRLHILIDSADPKAKLWATQLGFRFEAGPMKGYGARGNDEDFYLWEGERS